MAKLKIKKPMFKVHPKIQRIRKLLLEKELNEEQEEQLIESVIEAIEEGKEQGLAKLHEKLTAQEETEAAERLLSAKESAKTLIYSIAQEGAPEEEEQLIEMSAFAIPMLLVVEEGKSIPFEISTETHTLLTKEEGLLYKARNLSYDMHLSLDPRIYDPLLPNWVDTRLVRYFLKSTMLTLQSQALSVSDNPEAAEIIEGKPAMLEPLTLAQSYKEDIPDGKTETQSVFLAMIVGSAMQNIEAKRDAIEAMEVPEDFYFLELQEDALAEMEESIRQDFGAVACDILPKMICDWEFVPIVATDLARALENEEDENDEHDEHDSQ